MSEWIKSHNDGVILKVKIVPNSSKNQLSLLAEHLKINIIAPALENRANQELIKYLAKTFKLKKKDIQIISGEKVKFKQLFINNNSVENIKKVIYEVVNGQS
ncbi:MAG: DUF167 domain-containing protein [Spirochaetota bacterium]|nr:DUF167 domain-containing protein [Spirochaetota bacterium]